MTYAKKEIGFFNRINRDTIDNCAKAGMAIGVVAGGIAGGFLTPLPIPLGIFVCACMGMSVGAMLGLLIGCVVEFCRVSYAYCTEKSDISLQEIV